MIRRWQQMFAAGSLGLVGCSSGGTTTTSSSGSSSGGAEAGAPGDAATEGGGAVVLNGCTTFVDESGAAAARKIVWDFAVAAAANRCMIVKKGQEVAFEGNFGTHPLAASGGDAPNPFSSVPATGKVSFASAGTFGFICTLHSSMTGAIRVIE